MYRLVESSKPGEVERDQAVRLLTERAVLTRSLCRELLDCDGRFSDRRSSTALSFLLQWVVRNLPESVRVEPHPSDGIDIMVVPDDCQELLREIQDGAQVGEAFFMLLTADNSLQADGDRTTLRKRLDTYWATHSSAASAPSLFSSL
ncbi:MAG: hypothetical protein WBP93_19820 [Pyrinomonadaceae bacterium]